MTRAVRFQKGRRTSLVAGVVLGVAFAASGTAPPSVAAPVAAPAVSAGPAARASQAGCPSVEGAAAPASLSIPRVVGSTRVLPRGVDRRGVPLPPPLTDRGKWQLAWDKTVRVGAGQGIVRMTAHTYPWSGDHGSALGNRLLNRLRVGARVEVTGRNGTQRCYRVSQRVQFPANRSLPAYYSTTGPHRLAILVCSGTRRGPGDWSHRTVWFATPVG